MSVNIESSVSQINTGNNWFQNVKVGGQQEKEKAVPQPQAEAVKVSISQEAIENYQKQLHERGMNGANGKVIEIGRAHV